MGHPLKPLAGARAYDSFLCFTLLSRKGMDDRSSVQGMDHPCGRASAYQYKRCSQSASTHPEEVKGCSKLIRLDSCHQQCRRVNEGRGSGQPHGMIGTATTTMQATSDTKRGHVEQSQTRLRAGARSFLQPAASSPSARMQRAASGTLPAAPQCPPAATSPPPYLRHEPAAASRIPSMQPAACNSLPALSQQAPSGLALGSQLAHVRLLKRRLWNIAARLAPCSAPSAPTYHRAAVDGSHIMGCPLMPHPIAVNSDKR
jgi:hypothetical protein